MFKTLLTFAVVLTIASIAYAIDDFDRYANDAELDAAWVDVSVNDQGGSVTGASADVDLLIGDYPTVFEGSAAGDFEFTLTGGWDYPNAKAPWDPGYVQAEWEATSDRASIALNLIHPINIAACGDKWSLTFWIKPMSASIADLGDINVYGYGKNATGEDVSARTLIPCLRDLDQNYLQWWYPAYAVPAIVGPSTDLTGTPWEDVPVIDVGEWGLIVINSEHQIPWPAWTWGNVPWNDLVSLEKLVIEANSDTNMTTDMRETEGGDKYPIKGGVYSFAIDDIGFYAVPEPTTIALLGLGGLALRSARGQALLKRRAQGHKGTRA